LDYYGKGIYRSVIAFLAVAILLLFPSSQSYASDEEKERLQRIIENSVVENPPEDRVSVAGLKLTTSDDFDLDLFTVDGVLQNNRENSLDGASVSMTFYDEGGQFLGSKTAYPHSIDLQPGHTIPFTIDIIVGESIDTDRIDSIRFHVNMAGL
jgi:hypothetical protein